MYYHCTGNRGPCDKPYVREEELEPMFAEALGAIVIDDETVAFICDALRYGRKGADGGCHEAAFGAPGTSSARQVPS